MVEEKSEGFENESEIENEGKSEDEAISTLKEQLANAQKEMKGLQDVKTKLEQDKEELNRQLLSPEYIEKLMAEKETAVKKEEEVNLDEMTPSQLVQYVSRKRGKELDEVVGKLSKEIEDTNARIGVALARIDVQLTANKHTDFWDKKDNIYKVAVANPSWSAERCYKEVVRNERDVADEKLTAKKLKEKEEHKALTEKGGLPSSILKGKKLTEEEAANLAYDLVVGRGKGEE